MPQKRDNYFESVDEIMDVFRDKYVDDLKSFFIIGKFFGKFSKFYFVLFYFSINSNWGDEQKLREFFGKSTQNINFYKLPNDSQ